MQPGDASDESLVLAIQEQRIEALEEFYDRHHGTALAVALRVLRDRGMAEDVVQEAFLALWRQASGYNSERGAARTWFLSIVRHRAIDVTRGRAFSSERMSLDDVRLPPRYPDPWLEVNQSIEGAHIRNAVQQLPPEQRETITMAYFGGYTHQEISERTGVPLGTIKGRIRLAMQKLRSLTAGDLEPEESD